MKKLVFIIATMLTMATSAFAQIGSLSKDLVYTPVTPCRIMDTRNPGSKSGILVANSVRSFFGWAGTFAAQGGAAGSCGTLLDINEAAILVNFTVVTPDTGGYITAFPADVLDANKPLAATVNFNAGSVVGNNATVKLNQTGVGDDFKIYTTSNVHVVADIVGFYSKPVATALECVTTTAVTNLISSGPLNGVYYSGAVAAACAVGYTQTSLLCAVDNASASASPLNANQCGGNSNVNTHNVSASRVCCRIPGR